MTHETARAVAREMTRASDAEEITFGAVVGQLIAAGVERYHADLVRAEKTYFLPGGDTEVTPNHALSEPPATAFDPAGVDAAVRAIQGGQIAYREFCARIARAGCVGYLVSLTGRRAVYYGRTAETHVELFPAAA